MANDKSSKGVGGARGSKTSALSVGIWIFSGTTQIYVFVFVFVFVFFFLQPFLAPKWGKSRPIFFSSALRIKNYLQIAQLFNIQR